MPRIAVRDLPALEELHGEDLKGIYGGFKFSKPKISSPGPFQQKVIAATAVGAAQGAAFGSFAGPAGSVLGAVGGAVVGAGSTIATNHAQKKWTGGGLSNWNKPSRW